MTGHVRVRIDRIRVSGVDLSPEEAERLRDGLASELRGRLAGLEVPSDGSAGSLDVPPLELEPAAEAGPGPVATALAGHLAAALRGAGGA